MLVVVAWIVLSRAWAEALATLVAAGLPAAVVIGGRVHARRRDERRPVALDPRERRRDLRRRRARGRSASAALLARMPPPEPTAAVRRAALALVAVIAAAAIVVGAAHARLVVGLVHEPDAWPSCRTRTSRFVEAGSNYRWTWWKQAWRGWKEHPVAGTGAGSFRFTNLRYRTTSARPDDRAAQPAGAVPDRDGRRRAAAVRRRGARPRRRGAAPRPGPQLALALALPAYLVHGLIDIDWDFAAVSAPVFLIAGALAARPERRGASRPRPCSSAPASRSPSSCSLFAVWLGDRWTDAGLRVARPPGARRRRSRSARARSTRWRSSRSSRRRSPSSSAATSARRSACSRRRRELQPENAEAWYSLGEFDLRVRNCPRAALPELDRFTQLNPQDPANKEYDRALKLVNSGKAVC